jgi:chromosome segregation ATPase
LRLKLAEHYDVEEAGLARRREELVALGEKIAEQHRELTQLRDGVKSWAAARQQEIEQQARRLVEREIELDAQQEELRQARHIWHSERRDYERQIRELACQLAPVPGAA